jgi:hypothetical protein
MTLLKAVKKLEDLNNYSFYENEKIIEINKEPKGETIEKNQS